LLNADNYLLLIIVGISLFTGAPPLLGHVRANNRGTSADRSANNSGQQSLTD
jgi:hypothetical protein